MKYAIAINARIAGKMVEIFHVELGDKQNVFPAERLTQAAIPEVWEPGFPIAMELGGSEITRRLNASAAALQRSNPGDDDDIFRRQLVLAAISGAVCVLTAGVSTPRTDVEMWLLDVTPRTPGSVAKTGEATPC